LRYGWICGQLAATFALVVLDACAGGGGSSVKPSVAPLQPQAKARAPAFAMTKTALSGVRHVRLARADAGIAVPALRMRGPDGARRGVRSSVTDPNDMELAGTYIYDGGPYSAMYVEHTAYAGADFELARQPGAKGPQYLFAPVSAPPGGSCLAAGTLAINGGRGTSTYFVVIDRCAGGQAVVVQPIDAWFTSTFMAFNPEGFPVYVMEIGTTDPQPVSDSPWYVLLYDFDAGVWGIAAQSTGQYSPTYGFSAYDQQYQPGACPNGLPPVAADAIALWNTSSIFGSFEPVDRPPAIRFTAFVPPGIYNTPAACFTGDATGPASSTFRMLVPNAFWAVTYEPL
jgi:hypothetical protein